VITPTAREGGYLPIAAYALIGDGRSAALVGSDGSIDWLCLPCFDDASLFGRLLDSRRGGHWQLAPRGPYRVVQRYADRSNVLETVFETRSGRVLLSDLMPLGGDAAESRVVRILECLGGEMTLRHECLPAPGYAREGAAAPEFDGGVLRVDGGEATFLVTGTEPLTRTREELHLLTGESVAFGLHVLLPPLGADAVLRTGSASRPSAPSSLTAFPLPGADATPGWSNERALRLRRATEEGWWAWVARCGYAGPHQEAVCRSLLVLGLLTHAPTGAVVAAPTTSLPEGGSRPTRDLRLTSMRDAATAPSVFLRLGLLEEADALSGWLERNRPGGGGGPVRLGGGEVEGERSLDHLDGYRAVRPVHVGASPRPEDEDGDALAGAFQRAGALARRGEVEQAQRLFERLLTHRSPLGLLSGEADGRTGELLGNFPRAATHLALVAAAVDIERARAAAGGGPRTGR
jgi:GH15 family glucan-1,4-alpha-glucosidase